jgi:hypothetical protein
MKNRVCVRACACLRVRERESVRTCAYVCLCVCHKINAQTAMASMRWPSAHHPVGLRMQVCNCV